MVIRSLDADHAHLAVPAEIYFKTYNSVAFAAASAAHHA
jgi:hypothetical protein